MMLGFGAVMTVALIGMGVSVEARGAGAPPPLGALLAMLLLTAGGLVGLLRRLARAGSSAFAPGAA